MKEFKDLMAELRDFPRLIHESELKAEEIREAWEVEKVKRDYAYAGSFLKYKAMGNQDQQAKNKALQEVFESDQRLIIAESKYRKAAADHLYMENRFHAARKIANMQEAALLKLGTLVD